MPESYPAVIDQTQDLHYTLEGKDELVIGRSAAADVVVADPTVSRRQCRVIRQGKGFVLEPTSAAVPTVLDGQAIDQPTPLQHASVIQLGSHGRLQFLEREHVVANPIIPKTSPPPAVPAEDIQATFVPGAPPGAGGFQPLIPGGTSLADAPIDTDALPPRISLDSPKVVLGRDAAKADVHLSHPQVSRLHAQVTLKGDKATIKDLKSANGTFVNGLRVTTTTTLAPDDRIDIGPYALIFDGKALLTQTVRANNVELVGKNLKRIVKDRNTGQPLLLLDDVTVVLKPRDFTCLLGPSGSGKSTLLNALAARVPADEGSVTLNDEDLYTNFDALKPQIAVVPQKDVLHDMLTVGDALRYTARLRLPGDTSSGEIEKAVDEMLETVGLTHRKSTRIADLSGGQLKRASLANEIIAKPSLLFLDEVTSGLDEQTDREMMQLFREIADTGKTVACITHSLANVEENCTHVVILTPGGKLAFVGPPAEALTYFKIDRLGDVYERLAEKEANAWRDEFKNHKLYQQHVIARLPRGQNRAMQGAKRKPPTPKEHGREAWRQFPLLAQRYLQIMLNDRKSLAFMAGQCLLVAILLCMLYPDIPGSGKDFDDDAYKERTGIEKIENLNAADNQRILFPMNTVTDEMVKEAEKQQELRVQSGKSAQVLFLLTIVAFWFGVNNAHKEIIKEQVILLRERDVNLAVLSYYASKFALLGVVTCIQATVLYAIVKMISGVEGSLFLQWLTLMTVAMSGIALGLLISAVSKSTDMAATLVPIAVIPQIVLAGVLTQLPDAAEWLAMVSITCYWGYGAMACDLPTDMAKALRRDDWSFFLAYPMVVLHLLAFTSIGLFTLFAIGDRQNKLGGAALDTWLRATRKIRGGKSQPA